MKRVELYGRVRHAVMIEALSQREAARCFGIDPRTVRKMLSYSVPPGYVRTRPPVRPKLDPFIGIIDRILEEDKDGPKKQRHTSKRIPDQTDNRLGGSFLHWCYAPSGRTEKSGLNEEMSRSMLKS